MIKPAKDLKHFGIHALAQHINHHIELTWQALLETRGDHFTKVFAEIGDQAMELT